MAKVIDWLLIEKFEFMKKLKKIFKHYFPHYFGFVFGCFYDLMFSFVCVNALPKIKKEQYSELFNKQFWKKTEHLNIEQQANTYFSFYCFHKKNPSESLRPFKNEHKFHHQTSENIKK